MFWICWTVTKNPARQSDKKVLNLWKYHRILGSKTYGVSSISKLWPNNPSKICLAWNLPPPSPIIPFRSGPKIRWALLMSFGVKGQFCIILALTIFLKSFSVGLLRRPTAFYVLRYLFTSVLVNPSKFSPMVLKKMMASLWTKKLQQGKSSLPFLKGNFPYLDPSTLVCTTIYLFTW